MTKTKTTGTWNSDDKDEDHREDQGAQVNLCHTVIPKHSIIIFICHLHSYLGRRARGQMSEPRENNNTLVKWFWDEGSDYWDREIKVIKIKHICLGKVAHNGY
jgi:hypothetical protein